MDLKSQAQAPRAVAFNPSIVRGYDVRGNVKTVKVDGVELTADLTVEVAEVFGRALGSRLSVGDTVVVTSDHRHLSPELVAGLTRGYNAVGVNVLHNTPQPLYGGRRWVPTGALSWFMAKSGVAGSVQVTGSHNPPHMNGFKIAERGDALFGEDLQQVGRAAREGQYRPDVPESQRGSVREVDIVGQFLSMLGHAFARLTPRPIVVDSGNGVGRPLAALLERKGFQVIEMYPEPHPDFPNHPADPSTPKGTQPLQDKVRSLNRELPPGATPWLGIALDGDGDRSGFVDESGEVVWPERLVAAFYQDYLARPENKGAVLALDVRASDMVREMVEKAGGKGVFIPAGYPSHRKFANVESAAIGKKRVDVSGEASGHYFFATAKLDENGKPSLHGGDKLIDDGIFSALKFLEMLDRPGKVPAKVQDFLANLPSYPASSELRVLTPDDVKAKVVRELTAKLLARFREQLRPEQPVIDAAGVPTQDGQAGRVVVDGIRLQLRDGAWFVLRESNTSPYLVLKVEAKTTPQVLELLQELKGLLSAYPEVKTGPLDEEIRTFQSKLA